MKYQSHSKTSYAAALAILETADTLRAKVYRFIRDSGGATDEQIQHGLKMNPSTQRPRRIELVESGVIRDSGRTAKTISNRDAVLWELTTDQFGFPLPKLCPHGEEPHECDACMVQSDFAYDCYQERR